MLFYLILVFVYGKKIKLKVVKFEVIVLKFFFCLLNVWFCLCDIKLFNVCVKYRFI